MKLRYLLIALTLLLAAAPAKCVSNINPTVFQTDFEGADALSQWVKSNTGRIELVPGYRSSQSVMIEQQVEKDPGNCSIGIELPVEKIRDSYISLHTFAKAENVAAPPQIWNGVKFMLVIDTDNGRMYPSRQNLYGTFDWKELSFRTVIPHNATRVVLILGIEATTGKVWFDDLTVSVIGKALNAPAVKSKSPVFTGHPTLPRLRGAMVSPDVTPDDLHVLGSQWHANLIRYQLFWQDSKTGWVKDGWDNRAAYDKWLYDRLNYLDKLLPVCKDEGIKVVVDLHTVPGGTIGIGDWPLFEHKELQERFLRIWNHIAHRYKGNPVVWGYDLANEPMDGSVKEGLMDWHALAAKTAQMVRRIDPDHAIIIEPYGGTPAYLQYFVPIPVKGVVYSVHMYDPINITHQGVIDGLPVNVNYPGIANGVYWDKNRLESDLKDVADYQKRYHVAIYIGEFSCVRWAPGNTGLNYLTDVTSIFEKNGWDWSYHAFREWNGWSVEHGPDKKNDSRITQPTPRQLLLRSWYAKNKKPIFK